MRHHHYMTQDMNKGATSLLFLWDDVPIGFVSYLSQPNKGRPHGIRLSRMVILPDYQGLGLSSIMANFLASIIQSLGEDYSIYRKTIHPKVGHFLENSPNWEPTAYNGKIRKSLDDEGDKYKNRLSRSSYCYKYIGKPLYGYESLLLPIKEMRNNKKKN